MSGGSMQYLCWKLDDYKDELKDKMLVAMATDFVKVLHDAEWYLSGDICEGTYNETVKEFKNKWMNPKTIEKRYKEVIEDSV